MVGECKIPLKNVVAKTQGGEDEEMIVQGQVCEDFRDEGRGLDVDEIEDRLRPKLRTYNRYKIRFEDIPWNAVTK